MSERGIHAMYLDLVPEAASLSGKSELLGTTIGCCMLLLDDVTS